MTKYLLLSAVMFSIGAFGALSRRNILVVLMSIELMLNGANIALVTFARIHGDLGGHVFVLMVMGIAAAEVGIGLALIISLFRVKRTVDLGELKELKG